MSGKRITMRKIRDILRLRHEGSLSIRQIQASTKVSVGAIQKLLSRAKALGLDWLLNHLQEKSPRDSGVLIPNPRAPPQASLFG